jgi:prepilin-type N-terminal cleavage/methylation domain-containing protein
MKRSAFTMIELLIVMLIVATLIGLIVPAVMKVREAGARTRTVSFLKQLTLGLHSCNDVHKGLPPATGEFGDPAVTGTFHIHVLPFIEADNLHKMIAAGAVRDLKTVLVITFVSPLDFTQINDGAGTTSFAANLRVFADLGHKTKWDDTIAPDGNGDDPETGKPWYFGTASIPRSFLDGTSNTIALVTQYSRCGSDGGANYFFNSAGLAKNSPFFGYYAPKLQASADEGIKDGRTGEIFQILPAPESCNPSYTPQSLSRTAISVSLFDGSVRQVDASISVESWGRAVQPNDGQPLGQDWVQ